MKEREGLISRSKIIWISYQKMDSNVELRRSTRDLKSWHEDLDCVVSHHFSGSTRAIFLPKPEQVYNESVNG